MKEERYVEPSEIGGDFVNDYERHWAMMEWCEDLPLDKSFSITGDNLNIELLRDIGKEMSKPQKNYVVIEHTNALEVRCVSTPCDLFYKYVNASYKKKDVINFNKTSLDVRMNKMLEVMSWFITSDYETVSKYMDFKFGEQMKSDSVIPYSFIQRRLVSSSGFRTHKGGARAAIRETISELCYRGIIEQLKEETTIEKYETKAVLFSFSSN